MFLAVFIIFGNSLPPPPAVGVLSDYWNLGQISGIRYPFPENKVDLFSDVPTLLLAFHYGY
jgi:hypothetical protein